MSELHLDKMRTDKKFEENLLAKINGTNRPGLKSY